MGNINPKSQDMMQQESLVDHAKMLVRQEVLLNKKERMALQIAFSRQMLTYSGPLFCMAAVGLTARAIKRRKPILLVPLVPMAFSLALQADVSYRAFIHHMREEAEGIMVAEADQLNFPCGPPTFEAIEKEWL